MLRYFCCAAKWFGYTSACLSFLLIFFSITVDHRALNTFPCALQLDLLPSTLFQSLHLHPQTQQGFLFLVSAPCGWGCFRAWPRAFGWDQILLLWTQAKCLTPGRATASPRLPRGPSDTSRCVWNRRLWSHCFALGPSSPLKWSLLPLSCEAPAVVSGMACGSFFMPLVIEYLFW